MEKQKLPWYLYVLFGLFVVGCLWVTWYTYQVTQRLGKMKDTLKAHQCEIVQDSRIICSEHSDPAAHGCGRNDIWIDTITCKDGRKFELRSVAGGSVAIRQLQ